MTGKLYGVGIGPGDPDLMTLKSVKCLEDSNVIAYPVKVPGEKGVALEIVRQRVDISKKRVEELIFSMNCDRSVRKSNYDAAIARIASLLDDGNNVSMITLGDVSVYSTYMRVNADIEALGYETSVVPGVTSFSSGAAEAKVPLVMGEESLAIVSMNDRDGKTELAVDHFDNIVVMKVHNSMRELSGMLAEHGIDHDNATVISNVGMEDQYIGPMDLGRKYGYFTTVIVKKKRRKSE
jgi:precorrin-2/cobalt-factor-2 C20-methyltransferase